MIQKILFRKHIGASKQVTKKGTKKKKKNEKKFWNEETMNSRHIVEAM